MSVGTSVRVRTHAKVNLFLSVLGRRSDGYHELETILHAVDLFDDIEIAVKPDPGVDVEMIATDAGVGTLPSARDNLIVKAAETLIGAAGVGNGAHIRVTKRIPIGAGLGGGSGNAAAALVVLAELWGLGLERDDLMKHAATVGSDVSYCLFGGTALATARGEVLTPLPQSDPLWFVLAGMNYPLATREVYGALQQTAVDDQPGSAPMTLALGAGDV
ncbi:MAG TPA: 4-(cytidine 5'-diphospho)-2-C-methyl-D-erythritol kinase, partial [Vicinamibacterales bacterium]|nr:4-(cytidine 5'-diphospho)-2-C-methyl-D-erythritol kinase [Vicinamibacterales bacterium]